MRDSLSRSKIETYMKYRTPLITSVTSSIEGNTIPVTMSSAIFPYAVTFGGTCGNEKDGTLHLVILKEKDRKCLKMFQLQTDIS